MINIFISFSLKPSEPVIFNAIKEYSNILTKQNIAKSVLTKLTDSRDFKQSLMKPGEVKNDITGLLETRITVETYPFDDTKDTYGFLNIYIDRYKFTYGFKKVDITPFITDHTFFVNEPAKNSEILNTGGTLTLSCLNKIYIPSNDTLTYNINFEDVFLLPGEYLYNNLKKNQKFYTGFDYYGFFSILKPGKAEIFPSRFRLKDLDENTLNNIETDLAFRYLSWQKNGNDISPVSIEEKVISSQEKEQKINIPDIDTLIRKATVIINRDYHIPNYSTYLYGKGLFLFKNLVIESSSQPLIINGKMSLIGAGGLKIKRDISLEGDLSIGNFISLSNNKRDNLITASKIDGYLTFTTTPVVNGNLNINGNMLLDKFNKKNINGNVSITPGIIPRDNDIVTISPILNFMQGGIGI